MQTRTKKLLLVGAVLQAGFSLPVFVTGAWVRATAPGQTEAAAYLTLTSEVEDSLIGVSSPQAAHAMLHRSTSSDGVAGMSDMEAVPLPRGKPVRLQPRGLHVMLDGLVHGLAPGGHVTLTLRFAHADPVTVQAPVLPVGSAGP